MCVCMCMYLERGREAGVYLFLRFGSDCGGLVSPKSDGVGLHELREELHCVQGNFLAESQSLFH